MWVARRSFISCNAIGIVSGNTLISFNTCFTGRLGFTGAWRRRSSIQPSQHISQYKMSATNYITWSRSRLISRIRDLEAGRGEESELPVDVPPPSPQPSLEHSDSKRYRSSNPKPAKRQKSKQKLDPANYSFRYIALKLAYLGKNYGGFEYQRDAKTSIETELWTALNRACLILPEDEKVIDFECCDYSKCGRTDRGVSAFGQVIALRIRSNRPVTGRKVHDQTAVDNVEGAVEGTVEENSPGIDDKAAATEAKPFDPIKDEIDYIRTLNRMLPSDIRILAWCSDPPEDFSARFSCRERQYRYFFTQPAFQPEPLRMKSTRNRSGQPHTGWLDIKAMSDAARLFEGDHDFRNLCKIDPSKQITTFDRLIYESTIEEVKDMNTALPYLRGSEFNSGEAGPPGEVWPKVYYLNVKGSAFLWHQIRHMMAILFLIGQGLESPSLVSELLDVEKNPRKPSYTMADEVPLVLWDCIFPKPGDPDRKDAVHWRYVGDEAIEHKFGQFSVMDSLWESWREKKVDEMLANQLLNLVSRQGNLDAMQSIPNRRTMQSMRVFEGGNTGLLSGKYIPVLEKFLQLTPDEQNDKFAKRKGFIDAKEMQAQKALNTRATNRQTPTANVEEGPPTKVEGV